MSNTKIEWADKSWNVTTGCTRISEGCENCWARRMAKRLAGRFGYPKDEPFRVAVHPERLQEPIKWRKPQKVFVCSMGDLFHDDVSSYFLLDLFQTIEENPTHTFMILTKRPKRMKDWLQPPRDKIGQRYGFLWQKKLPLDNLWLGVSVENQKRADERIPILLQIPARVRFVSVEPMLGPVDLTAVKKDEYRHYDSLRGAIFGIPPKPSVIHGQPQLNWVVLGGETGPRARPMMPEWAISVLRQCQEAGVPFFFKRYSQGQTYRPSNPRILDGKIWDQYPE